MEMIRWFGLTMSLGAGLLLLSLIYDLFRVRRPFPVLRHGNLEISGGFMRWVWFVLLFGTFASVGASVPLLQRYTLNGVEYTGEIRLGIPEEKNGAQSDFDGWSESRMNLPFYRVETREIRYRAPNKPQQSENRSLVLPFWFLLAAYLYWRSVVQA
ncbi:MAG: hypothetical protein JO040_00340 [Gemmatimonadetes bacterium]|nr:hypothetical protein [Gemmatimonadota bacterium]